MPNPPSAPLPNPARLRPRGDVVYDEITGLAWQRDHGPASAWAVARDACDGLLLDGHDDWRLPTRIELVTLIDFTRVPTIDPIAFADTPDDYFWTASPRAGRSAERWSVYFGLGEVVSEREAAGGAFHRCVRAGRRLPGPRFAVDAGGGVVRDRATGLAWQRRPMADLVSWQAARLACEGLLVTEGLGGWRQPSLNELQSLVDDTREGPAVDPAAFFAPPPAPVWGWAADAETRAHAVDLAAGTATLEQKSERLAALCVAVAVP